MFAAEFDALQQLEKTQALQVPEPIAHGVDDGFAWLVTEFLDLVPAKASWLMRPWPAIGDAS